MREAPSAPRTLAVVAGLLVSGCWTAPRALVRLSADDTGTWIDGLSSCHPEAGDRVQLDPTKPLTVLVHGCSFSRGSFRTLAQVFEAHGQQTVCFNYDDRNRLETSSAQLIDALDALGTRFGDVTVVGHSQGGLVARRAFIREREHPLRPRPGVQFKLVTVSSPFAGIASSKDCGKLWLHVLTLGITVGVCQGIAGDKWHEIYAGSDFMRHPGTLIPEVASHLKVVTNERGACRRTAADGSCAESDFVFGLDEQYADTVDKEARATNVEVAAGHVEIVGERGTPPTKLLDVLQAHGVLAELPPEQQAQVAALVAQLY